MSTVLSTKPTFRDKHIVLDIDQTLLWTVPENHPVLKTVGNLQVYKVIEKFATILRPNLIEFLLFCFRTTSSVSLYSAGTKDYVSSMASFLLHLVNTSKPERRESEYFSDEECDDIYSFTFVYCINNCKKKSDGTNFTLTKPLKRMWEKPLARQINMNSENTIMIDDVPSYCVHNYGNAIYIPPFSGQQDDDILLYLGIYITLITYYCEDVTVFEKREWLKIMKEICKGNPENYVPEYPPFRGAESITTEILIRL